MFIMSSLSYSIKYKFGASKNYSKVNSLKKNPQKKGIMMSVTTKTPKKPNSAISKMAKVRLNNFFKVTASLPGSGYLPSKYNSLLISGGSANDLPGVNFTAMSGVYDFMPMISKKSSSSIYGVYSPEGLTKHVSSCFSSLNL